ncbi:hypothetical protein LX32DRAFT_240075 [Colletotrichum zoysiae]|uniref:Transmembrane protein n=1 Tax=Colletotrichum zoysiae TaxID=1216348 RepID=A0AAD9H4I9_9PEZI|nr:hypothetical protein LX32DRAFT_240075 [Colletotrichum zoysiae]
MDGALGKRLRLLLAAQTGDPGLLFLFSSSQAGGAVMFYFVLFVCSRPSFAKAINCGESVQRRTGLPRYAVPRAERKESDEDGPR